MKTFRCIICGEEFPLTRWDRICCSSKKCQYQYRREIDRERKRTNVSKKYHSKQLDENIKKASEQGISYGKMKAQKYIDDMLKNK